MMGVPYRIRPKRASKIKNEPHDRDLACWLALLTRGSEEQLQRQGIAAPNTVLRVSGSRSHIPMTNIHEKLTETEKEDLALTHNIFEAPEISIDLKPHRSNVYLRPAKVVYRKRYFNPEDEVLADQEEQVKISVNHGRVSAITLNCREEAGSEFNTGNNSEIPVTAEGNCE